MNAELYDILIRETDDMRKELKKIKEDMKNSTLKQSGVNPLIKKPYHLNEQKLKSKTK